MLVLASASPRRTALLAEAGIEHRVLTVSVDETIPADIGPADAALALAVRKARAARDAAGTDPVLAADTLVVLDGRAIGKPRSPRQAVATLEALSGREHEVVTGLCLLDPVTGGERTRVIRTRVTFRELTSREIREYVATGEPLDKAGAYGIQAGAAKFVAGVSGSGSNVIGLPVETVRELLAEEA